MEYLMELKITCEGSKFKTYIYTNNFRNMSNFIIEKFSTLDRFKLNELIQFSISSFLDYISLVRKRKRVASKKMVKLYNKLKYVYYAINDIPLNRPKRLSIPMLRVILAKDFKHVEITKIKEIK